VTNERRRRGAMARRIGDAWTIGLVLPAAIVIGYFFGWAADGLLHTAPWGGYIGGGLGVVAGFLEVIRTALRLGAEEDRAAREGDNDIPR